MAENLTFDHYEVLTCEDGSPFELGRGAMGITYKAFDTNLRVHVALKVINARFLESEIAQQRFLREARAAAQLRHPNVASVYHLGTSADAFFYAMEFVDGETVESFIKRQGPIDPVVALRITLQVARALAAAEKVHLVHRDIKPANLMLVREDDDFLVKVIDFGLAKSIKHEGDDDLATLSMGGFVGTAHFASPEQLEEKEIDVRSDIYSLGVTLWYMLAGEAPFGGSLAQVMSQHLHKPPPLEKLQNLPECVRAAVGHMIEKDPAARPQTPSALRGELENCLTLLAAGAAPNEQDFPTMVEAPGTSAPELHPPPLPQPGSSSRGMIWGLLLVVFLLGAGLLFFLKTRQPTSAPPAAGISPTPSSAVAQATLAPTASPAPSLGESPGLTREAMAEAEKFEAAQDWPRAIAAYVEVQKKFPKNEVGRVRLELMLSKLQSEKSALPEENFDAWRGPLTDAAKLEVVSAMEILAESLRKRDPKASFEWLSAAAARGRAHAMAEVGLRYSNGAGVERDFVKAAQWFEKARAAGDVSARTLLAECYLFGKGVSKDEAKAITLLQDAAAANDPRAMDQLGTCYHKGIGVARDDREAFRFYSAAAKLNYLDSAGNLGVLYLTSDGTDLGKNLPARTEKAVDLFREGAKQNNAFCMFLYARCFEGGTGVEANPGEAIEWYRRAAEAGNRAAQDWCRQHKVDFQL
ncbi:MAG: protein kinase [Verrucomicrobiota bacterium]|nr:SEL1-like repeat protein [Chthoniobacterales bacterium]MDQ3413793.1 protein kinase [Verrucomicrobiota bacterium]